MILSMAEFQIVQCKDFVELAWNGQRNHLNLVFVAPMHDDDELLVSNQENIEIELDFQIFPFLIASVGTLTIWIRMMQC